MASSESNGLGLLVGWLLNVPATYSVSQGGSAQTSLRAATLR